MNPSVNFLSPETKRHLDDDVRRRLAGHHAERIIAERREIKRFRIERSRPVGKQIYPCVLEWLELDVFEGDDYDVSAHMDWLAQSSGIKRHTMRRVVLDTEVTRDH